MNDVWNPPGRPGTEAIEEAMEMAQLGPAAL
jgi:hypothetical protein